MKHALLIVLLLPLVFSIGQTTYYVSNTGSDSKTGKSEESSWQTLSKVSNQSFKPGDKILLEKNGVWRESLSLKSSGTDGNHIYYGSYGEGNQPRILGSIEATGWTNISGNIWESGTEIPLNPHEVGYSAQVFFRETFGISSWGHYENYNTNLSNLTDLYDWTWNDKKIYVYSDDNPDTKFLGVEAPQRSNGIIMNDHEYITFNDLYIGYLVAAGVRDKYPPSDIHGLTVTNCEIAYIGVRNSGQAFGLSVWHSDAYFARNKIHDCGRRSISINVYDTEPNITLSNILIEKNKLYNGFHTTGVDCINSGGHLIENIIIRNNIISGDPTEDLGGEDGHNSNHIFIAKQGTGNVQNIKIYNNVLTYVHGKGVGFEGVDKAEIYSNTFYGVNPTLHSFSAQAAFNMGSDISIMNNIFYSDLNHSFFEDFFCLYYTGSQEPDNFNVDYNLYFTEDKAAAFADIYLPGNYEHRYKMNNWISYKSDNGWDANSKTPSDPKFISPPNNFGISDGSPAIGAGMKIDWINIDYHGNEIGSTLDLGAIQYGSIAGIPETTDGRTLSIYPNPAGDFVNIKVTGEMPNSNYVISIYNMSGQQVYQSNVQNATESIKLAMNDDIKQGLYFVVLDFKNNFKIADKLLLLK